LSRISVLNGLLPMNSLVLEQQVQSTSVGGIGFFEVSATDIAPIPVDAETRGILIRQTWVVDFRGGCTFVSTH
jgi:hypothetical protein